MASACLAVAACSDKDPSEPLTANEGAALLKDIRNDKARIKNLTPAEREYLRKKLAR